MTDFNQPAVGGIQHWSILGPGDTGRFGWSTTLGDTRQFGGIQPDSPLVTGPGYVTGSYLSCCVPPRGAGAQIQPGGKSPTRLSHGHRAVRRPDPQRETQVGSLRRVSTAGWVDPGEWAGRRNQAVLADLFACSRALGYIGGAGDVRWMWCVCVCRQLGHRRGCDSWG